MAPRSGESDEEYNKRRRSQYADLPPEEKEVYKKDMRERASKRLYPSTTFDYRRDFGLKKKFGISSEDFDRMLEEQNGLCGICGTSDPGGRWNRFPVDHCHKTGKVRGLLCNNCNRGLGLLDTEEKLRGAIAWLAK
jgi:hypothetical protein